ncbi:MAG TPA: ATP-binding protein [Rhizorhapis sp.]|nr:ATP-binding protein [Rhizorhapis sp.]HKR17575.1 ATP-binding protein [Rhizorhapis sp.]
MAALLFFVSQASKERDQALTSQRHSFVVMNIARALDATISRSESTLARYVISTDKDVGRVYQSEWGKAGQQLELLARETRKDPAQKVLVAQLRDAYLERGRELNDIALRTSYDQKMGSLARFHQAGQAESLARINALLKQVIKAEEAVLEKRSKAVSATESRSETLSSTYRIFGLIILVGALGMGWAANAALSDRRHASRLAEAESLRAADLEEAVTSRTLELKIANEKLHREAAERAAAEESLRQMQKMEAVGQLTGGIAHDFNNMLAVVVGGLELARRKLHQDPAHAERHIANAMEGANRASALTRRLLAFARSEPLLPQVIDPDDLICGMTELIDRTIGDQIKVKTVPGTEGWKIWVDRHQLENAILNLAVNARDAMDGKGTLTISTQQAQLASGEIGECSEGDYIVLSVEDTGCGMPPEVLSRVFEPFFTTKPVGKGTGLGLSQLFGFVGQCRGEIQIQSEVGTGTEVLLYLPRHHVAEEQNKDFGHQMPSHEAVEHDAGLTILVVEDDPRVLSATIDALVDLGHHPIACDHPMKAASLLESHADIQLIVSDVLMPDMTGPEMVAHLRKSHPSIPVLFVSGFAGDIDNAAMFEGCELLRKPYTIAALSAAIGKALSARQVNEQLRETTAAATS